MSQLPDTEHPSCRLVGERPAHAPPPQASLPHFRQTAPECRYLCWGAAGDRLERRFPELGPAVTMETTGPQPVCAGEDDGGLCENARLSKTGVWPRQEQGSMERVWVLQNAIPNLNCTGQIHALGGLQPSGVLSQPAHICFDSTPLVCPAGQTSPVASASGGARTMTRRFKNKPRAGRVKALRCWLPRTKEEVGKGHAVNGPLPASPPSASLCRALLFLSFRLPTGHPRARRAAERRAC